MWFSGKPLKVWFFKVELTLFDKLLFKPPLLQHRGWGGGLEIGTVISKEYIFVLLFVWGVLGNTSDCRIHLCSENIFPAVDILKVFKKCYAICNQLYCGWGSGWCVRSPLIERFMVRSLMSIVHLQAILSKMLPNPTTCSFRPCLQTLEIVMVLMRLV